MIKVAQQKGAKIQNERDTSSLSIYLKSTIYN